MPVSLFRIYGYILFPLQTSDDEVNEKIEDFVKEHKKAYEACENTWYSKQKMEVFYDVHPGNTFDRPNWNRLQEQFQKGDELVVISLQTFSRATFRTTLTEIDNLKKRGIRFTVLHLLKDNDKDPLEYIFEIYDYFEDVRLERQGTAIASIAANIALRREKYPGRKTVLDKPFLEQLQDLLDQNVTSPTELARRLDKSRSTIYKALKLLKEQEEFPSSLSKTIADGET